MHSFLIDPFYRDPDFNKLVSDLEIHGNTPKS